MEVNGEPCTGEDISSKLEDKDVQDGRRFDTERDTFACLEDTIDTEAPRRKNSRATKARSDVSFACGCSRRRLAVCEGGTLVCSGRLGIDVNYRKTSAKPWIDPRP